MENHERHPSGGRSYRRDVMKAVGAGAGLATLSGVAAGNEHELDGDEGANEGSEAPEGVTMESGTVHVVRTHIGESTNPERPADFFYEPTGLYVEPGDVVTFVFETPDHTVTSYHPAFGMERRIPLGVSPISSPILGWDPNSLPEDAVMPPAENGADEENGPAPSTWLHSFDTPGVYDLECAPHEGFGMTMRVVAGEETETAFETADPEQLPSPRVGPVGLARQTLTDPNLEPETIVEQETVGWMDLEANETTEADDGSGDDDGNEEINT